MTSFIDGIDDLSISSVFEEFLLTEQFVNAIAVQDNHKTDSNEKLEGERFGGLTIAATKDYCEQRAPVLETFIKNASDK